MAARALLVFDLDGTLVDTVGDLVATLNTVLAEAGCDPLPTAEARGMIGHGARALLSRGLAARGMEVSPARMDDLHRRFLAHYEQNIAVHSRPLPGLDEALDDLHAEGVRFAVLTNKLDHLARKLIGELGMTRRFEAIVGSDTFAFSKPDPRVYRATLERAGAAGAPSLMVGDSMTDHNTARNAGVPSLIVSFGYTETPVSDFGADKIVDHWHELAPAARSLLGLGAA